MEKKSSPWSAGGDRHQLPWMEHGRAGSAFIRLAADMRGMNALTAGTNEGRIVIDIGD
jgi:hypothetical protein